MTGKITAVQKIQEVSALLSIPGSRIIAGGTGFSGDAADELHLVDISGLEGLDSIRQKGSRIEIGPLAKLQTLADSALIRTHLPALARAADITAPAEVKERATIGGSIASARISDIAAALLAAGAKLTIKTDSDYRELLIDRFWDQNGENDLQYDEWITRITLQIPKDPRTGSAFGKLGIWSLSGEANAAAAVQIALDDHSTVKTVRGGFRLGTAQIRRMFSLEKNLKNQVPTEEIIHKAACSVIPSPQNSAASDALVTLLTEIIHRALACAEERRTL